MSEIRIDENILSSNSDTVLKTYYERYLLNVRGVKKKTVNHYFDALNNISRRLKAMNLVVNNIYEIADLERLENARDILYANPDFIQLNTRGNRMYSVGLNNYIRFAKGEDFEKVKENIVVMDVPVSPTESVVVSQEVWRRSGILRIQAIEFAGYVCEIDNAHKTFIAEASNKPYMEGHHAIPMKLQGSFSQSLDVYANIVCLCPLCHRKIHYGQKNEKVNMIYKIYDNRAERLAKSGIMLSKTEFVDLTLPSKAVI